MASEVLKNIAANFSDVDASIKEAEELIAALKQAGEDTSKLQSDLTTLKSRAAKWRLMLKTRGLTLK